MNSRYLLKINRQALLILFLIITKMQKRFL